MKYKIILTIVSVTGCIVAVLLCLNWFVSYVQTDRLCQLIKEEQTEDALKLVSRMHNVNRYTAPEIFNRIFIIFQVDMTSPLVRACEYENSEVVSALLEKGADPNMYLDGDWTPIEATCKYVSQKRYDIAEELISYGADVDLYASGWSALHSVSNYFYYDLDKDSHELIDEFVILLLENGASPIFTNGYTLTHSVSCSGDISLLKTIIEKYNCPLDDKNHNGESPLLMAIKADFSEAVEYLLEKGADIDVVDEGGKTVFDYAVEIANPEIIDILNRYKIG